MNHTVANPCSVSYMPVAEVEGHFSIGLFLFKHGAKLPLHDHPRMSVYTRYSFYSSTIACRRAGNLRYSTLTFRPN